MPTKNPSINIVFEKQTVDVLTRLAQQEQKSVASFAKELLLEVLEHREDAALSVIAEACDVPKARRVKHGNVWK